MAGEGDSYHLFWLGAAIQLILVAIWVLHHC